MPEEIKKIMSEVAKAGTSNSTPFEISQIEQQSESRSNELDWNEERARAWHKMQPPSKPSKSEINIYKKYFEIKKNEYNPRVLILGSTVEFRQLAFELGFNVTVVDYSKTYHDIISEDLGENKAEILNSETPIYCEWSEMLPNDKLEEESFDIIIGDLAVGNVSYKKIDKFFENISKLLKKDGYFLGKSIYTYSDFKTDKHEIIKKLQELVDNNIVNDSIVYAKTMYDLSVFNADIVDKKANTKKINFANLYALINEFVGTDNARKKIFSIYLGEDTNFKDKMPSNFYIYEYSYILDLLNKCNFDIIDIEYGNDYYKDNYPLLILQKVDFENESQVLNIQTFISNNDKFLVEWKKNIASRFFLINLDQVDSVSDRCISLEEIKTRIRKLFNQTSKNGAMQAVEIGNDLNFTILSIEDEAINRETDALVKGTSIEYDETQKEKLKKHFIYGILFYEAYVVQKEIPQNKCNDIEKLILKELFKDVNETKINHLWDPHDSPWVAAKICICLLPLYKQYEKDKKTSLIFPYLSQLENVVEAISTKINQQDCMWHTEIGSMFDTSALCLEVLYGYKNCFKGIYKDKSDKRALNTSLIKSTIDKVLKKYVLHGKICETFIKYPIYLSLIEQVCANSDINGKPAYKKMCGRIEWYTILYMICKDESKNPYTQDKQEDYTLATKYIAKQLRKFWYYFNINIEKIYKQTKEKEISLIPQIVYCISHSKVLEDD